jgi:branched-chain amino acid transport system ATP-binding protein
VIEISGLTVRFGGVTPLDDVTLQLGAGTNGLIGPNGAGKTTFFNVLSGFVRPEEGTVNAFDVDILAMPAFRRARWGVRRTFQTEQAVANLSVYENVLLIEEQSSRRSSTLRADVIDAVEFVGLGPRIRDTVGTLGAAERRLVEVARAVVGKPRLVLLDEPAAGLPEDETALLGDIIRRIPESTGAMVVLVDHDMELVSATCTQVAVLDFGRVIANGNTREVLADPLVIRAYLGVDESVQA